MLVEPARVVRKISGLMDDCVGRERDDCSAKSGRVEEVAHDWFCVGAQVGRLPAESRRRPRDQPRRAAARAAPRARPSRSREDPHYGATTFESQARTALATCRIACGLWSPQRHQRAEVALRGMPNRSRSPCTTAPESAPSSSNRRLCVGSRPARRGGWSGKARQRTPIAPTASAVRQATRAPSDLPPTTSGRPCSRVRGVGRSPPSTRCRADAGAGDRRPATRYGCSTMTTLEPLESGRRRRR